MPVVKMTVDFPRGSNTPNTSSCSQATWVRWAFQANSWSWVRSRSKPEARSTRELPPPWTGYMYQLLEATPPDQRGHASETGLTILCLGLPATVWPLRASVTVGPEMGPRYQFS